VAVREPAIVQLLEPSAARSSITWASRFDASASALFSASGLKLTGSVARK
jgi:hypothetical protein